MDSYPEDLLVGVFPLVFAVDTIQSNGDGGGDDQEQAASSKRTLFDRFLDAVAASLNEDEEEDFNSSNDRRRNVSLFRSESDDSDDDGLEEFHNQKRRSGTGIYPGFGRRVSAGKKTQNENSEVQDVASFASALTHGQGFFQRARIESIGTKHGFPPSKDPKGTKSLAHNLPPLVRGKNRDQKLASIFQDHALDGILPAGWLEKQVHALPSVILVVCGVSSSQSDQEAQDIRLFEIVENLRESLAPKRQCTIHIVGLMDDDLTQVQADVWSRSVATQIEGIPPPPDPLVYVNLLRASSDLQANDTGMPTSPALRHLHRTVRDASMTYYLGQARRTKDKLAKLRGIGSRRGRNVSGTPVELLPLVIRYYFKISLYYEFQWKHEKSLRYMSEGYRHIVKYYHHLVSKNFVGDFSEDDENLSSHDVAENEDSVEVSISDSSKSIVWSNVVPEPPDDMIHQCRAVADWMNFKILSAGFASRTGGGLLAASSQWRHHSAMFCSRKLQASPSNSAPEWRDWSYVAHQRIIVSELVERNPPTALGDLGKDSQEVLVRCSPWRNYESAAEAVLRLSAAVQKALATLGQEILPNDSEKSNPMRPRYVGGLGRDDLMTMLKEESRVEHKEKALDLLLRAISLFEREAQEEKRGFYAEDEFSERSSSRTGARLYYLTGGVLLGMGRHKEAVSKLSRAAKFARGWNELELAIRRLLIECYGKHMPSESDTTEDSDALASMILDSYFNAQMSSTNLRKALVHFSSITGGESLKWFHEATEDEQTRLPFSFAVSFPGRTHATAGDAVKASVLIQSNLDYAVHVNSATLLSLAGEIPMTANDLLSAANASEGGGGGIIIQAKTAIIVSTEVKLPKDLLLIASDDSGNGGEQQGVAGKGSFAKSARPRTAGITAAGGARLVSEGRLGPGNQRSQGWSLNFLGGKTLRCDGLRLIFYPVQAEKASAEKVTLIELTIRKKKPRTAANIKRTPFEEENYIASAWSRPQYVPLSRGPRSLRVLGPIPQLVVTNLTEAVTKGKALEGTVNRLLLKLQAGPQERCSNMKISISCFSVLVTPSGSTKRLVAKEEVTSENENSVDMTNPKYRTPTLVSPGDGPRETGCGYELPKGWVSSGSGLKLADMHVPSLDAGECSYVHLDIFRPAISLHGEGSQDESPNPPDHSLCKTDVYITVSYRRGRKEIGRRRPARRSLRRPVRRPAVPTDPEQPEATAGEETSIVPTTDEDSFDDVSLEYTGSVVWTSPLTASFTPGTTTSFPSGSRHPSNAVGDDRSRASDLEFSLIDGETAIAKCALRLDDTMDELKTEVTSVRFKNLTEDDPAVDFVVRPGASAGDGNLLDNGNGMDSTRILSKGSEFSVVYAVQAMLKSGFRRGGVSSPLGILEVDWAPVPLALPEEMTASSKSTVGSVDSHGPLILQSSQSTVRFKGPACYIESAPFSARVTSIPSAPSVAIPFEVCYSIENKTGLHQLVTIQLRTAGLTDGSSNLRDGFLIAGTTNGELTLGPNEKQTVKFSLIATRPGLLSLPGLQVASTRYKSWVIHEEGGPKNEVYVFP